MSALRFFFAERFNRFDVAMIVIATALRISGDIGFLAMLAMLFVGFMLSGIGEVRLRRHSSLPSSDAPPASAPSCPAKEARGGTENNDG